MNHPTRTIVEPLEPRRLLSAGEIDPTFHDRLFGSTPGRSDIPVVNFRQAVDFDVSSIGQVFVTTETYNPVVPPPEGQTDTDAFDVQVYRLHPDGTRDARFGTSGNGSLSIHVSPTVFTVDDDGTVHEPHIHTHVLPDDSLLIQIGNLIYKYGTNGKPDRSFGDNGRMTARLFAPTLMQDAAMDRDGRVVVIGLAGEMAVARLATNGKPDLSFNPADPSGRIIPFTGVPRDMVAQALPDGSMILGGIAEGTLPPGEDFFASYDLELVKLTPDGTIDTSYGDRGTVHTQESITDIYATRAHDPGILSDGTFFFTREQENRDLLQSTYQTVLTRPDGSQEENPHPYNSLHLARDGALRVTITYADPSLEPDFPNLLGADEVIVRADAGGSPDTAARAATQAVFGDEIAPLKVAFQPDGSPLVLASSFSTTDDPDLTLSVFRLQRDESPAGLLDARSLVTARDASYRFRVNWRDEDGIDPASLGDDDVSVTFPDGVRRHARLVDSIEVDGDKLVWATYSITATDGQWTAEDDGRYQVRVERKSVRDTLGNPAGRRRIGGFTVAIPAIAQELRPAASVAATPRVARLTKPADSDPHDEELPLLA
jgi:uncharacterized delta-60 repeat protein